jgi:hypothetical protein
MPIQLESLFVSSTSDLAEEREAVQNVIREHRVERQLLPYISDFDMRPGETPEERVREEIRNADLFIIILGGRYGSLYPKAEKPAPPSICEWEFEEARKRGVMMLSLEKMLLPETIEEPQRRFRERVRQFCSGTWQKTFSNREEFSKILVGTLIAWGLSEKKSLNRVEGLTWAILALGAGLLLVFPWLDNGVSRSFVSGALVMIAVVILGFSGQNLIGGLRR